MIKPNRVPPFPVCQLRPPTCFPLPALILSVSQAAAGSCPPQGQQLHPESRSRRQHTSWRRQRADNRPSNLSGQISPIVPRINPRVRESNFLPHRTSDNSPRHFLLRLVILPSTQKHWRHWKALSWHALCPRTLEFNSQTSRLLSTQLYATFCRSTHPTPTPTLELLLIPQTRLPYAVSAHDPPALKGLLAALADATTRPRILRT